VTGISRTSWLWRPVGRAQGIGWGDIALAAVLTVWAVLLVSGLWPGTRNQGGVFAAVAVLAMTVPVAWERRAPLAAAAVLAVGALGNELLAGHLVRCGPGLPAVLLVAFFAATRLDVRGLVVAEACCLASIALQAFYDPQLGAGFLVAGIPALAGACIAGRVVRSRSLAAATLRARNAELREQREQTARLAVAADRARVAEDLHDFVRDQIGAISATATVGRRLVTSDPEAAQSALASVETSGRETLTQMREVVGNLRADRLTGPQPVLAELGSLLEKATTADARLHVVGSPRTLPAGLELTAYRIVEHLLEALEDASAARIDVTVRFGDESLELDVAGPAHAQPATAFAIARERAELLGGTLDIDSRAGRCAALVRLPLTAGYATS
jgi:signal transduction histidine kinase